MMTQLLLPRFGASDHKEPAVLQELPQKSHRSAGHNRPAVLQPELLRRADWLLRFAAYSGLQITALYALLFGMMQQPE